LRGSFVAEFAGSQGESLYFVFETGEEFGGVVQTGFISDFELECYFEETCSEVVGRFLSE